jgi:hypothetical protein
MDVYYIQAPKEWLGIIFGLFRPSWRLFDFLNNSFPVLNLANHKHRDFDYIYLIVI